MATELRHRRGTSAQIAAATPAQSEFIHNVETNTIHVGDGSTKGGHALAKKTDITILFFDNLAMLSASNIPASVKSVRTNGSLSMGDGLGGMYIDVNNGSADTVTSVDGRTWYKVKDVSEGRLEIKLKGVVKNSVSRASIVHKRTATYNYEKIKIWGGVESLKKVNGKGFRASDGATVTTSLGSAVAENGYECGVNCDASFPIGGGMYSPSGLYIIDGVAYQNFNQGPQPNPELMRDNIIMNKDGSMRAASITDGKTAQNYVDEGALWSVGWGSMLVKGGVKTTLPTGEFFTQLSARTVLGHDIDGNYIILTVEGKTNSYGISLPDMQNLCIAEGMVLAMNLDGGGSTQAWWKGGYSLPSSDETPRFVGNFLAINTHQTTDFDTREFKLPSEAAITSGEVSVRQINGRVSLSVDVFATLPLNAYVVVSKNFPVRFRPDSSRFSRTQIQGSQYKLVGCALDGTMTDLNLRATIAADTFASGTHGWPSKWSQV